MPQTYTSEQSPLQRGKELAANLNPDLHDILETRYGQHLPGFADTLIEFAYGRLYSRNGLDMRTRQIATVAALTAMGGQTGQQLEINLEHALAAGATEQELLEIILQMSVYGGMPATINALNRAIDFFASKEQHALA